jgi:RNA polymerase sigma-70 factor (ECF subfamily)
VGPPPSTIRPDIGAIFDEHFDFVWNTLRRLGVHSGDIEDLAHEVFLKVYARLDDYDSSRPLRPWLAGFVCRVAADYRRLARHRIEVYGSPIEAQAPVVAADERLQAADDRSLLNAALAVLDFDRRAVLVLHDVDDVPVPSIAAELGIPLNTAYSRLRLAREELATAVRRLRRRREEVCRV